jgi:hypothetical protein
MPDAGNDGRPRALAESLEEVRFLHELCRQGRLYDVERWIAEGKPLQLAPAARPSPRYCCGVATGAPDAGGLRGAPGL